jgi:hypothetical protein
MNKLKPLKDIKKLKKVVVDWVDICKRVNDDEFNDNDNIDDKLAEITTIGWLYSQTKNCILLMQESYEGTMRDWIIIPKCVITKITYIQ